MSEAETTEQNPITEQKSIFGRFFGFIGGVIGFFTGITMLVTVCGLIFATVGFVRFTNEVASQQNDPEIAKADAIVVLTGGKDRIETGTRLLRTKLADKMLISGVNPEVSKSSVLKQFDIEDQLHKCCIEFDFAAKDTVGNAKHTSSWVERNAINSLIVVTSDYHLPRGLLELKNAMPGVKMESFTVTYKPLREANWYTDIPTMKLMILEYSKFLAASVKLNFAKLRVRAQKFTKSLNA